MRRHEPPFSNDVDDDRDITQQFWGGSRGWTDQLDRPRPSARPRAQRRDDTTGAIRAIRDGVAAFRPQTSVDASGPIDRTRSHGIVRPRWDDDVDAPAARQAHDDAVPTDDDEFWHDADTARLPIARRRTPLRREPEVIHRDVIAATPEGGQFSLAAVDPLLLRVGIFVLALVILFPLAWAMRSDDAGTVTTGTAADNPAASVATTVVASPTPDTTLAPAPQPAPAAGQQAPAAAPAPEPAPTGSSTAGGSSGSQTGSEPSASSSATASSESASNGSGSQTNAVEPPAEEPTPTVVASGIADDPATVSVPADRVEPDCSQSYAVQPGDSWYSIAEAAGISPTDLISSNQASLQTVILPGEEICLPAGATVPPQTTTTTAAPTTTTTEPSDSSEIPETSPEEVQQMIRDIWPDELEDKALEVAFRESRYQHDAYNGWCCYGVFQIYWSVHQSWLDDYDIYRAEDLFHARKNIEAAYALYRAAGGWSPWSQTAY